MKLYVIRHGESENNISSRYTGWMKEVLLTKKGFNDARGISEFLGGIDFDKIYTSDLMRAKQTAKTALPDCTYEETPLIREISLGSLEGKTFAECDQEYGEPLAENKKNSNYIPYGGENREMLMERVKQFLDTVAQSDNECVAAFAHDGFLRAALRYVLNVDILASVQCPNCTIAVFEYKNDKWWFNSWINPQTLLNK